MSEPFDIIVIGSGPGGYIAALKGAQRGAKVAVVEQGLLGGTCLNVGCIPSKALLASAELLHRIGRAGELGVTVSGAVGFDWAKIQARKDKVLAALRGGVKGLFDSRKVTLVRGRGRLAGKGKVAVASDAGTRELTAKNVILAVGSTPARIPGWPTDGGVVCTSDEALHWKELPTRLLIVGGGVIGCEFACMMAQYSVRVTVVERLPALLPEMEPQFGAHLAGVFARRGIEVLAGAKVEDLTVADGRATAVVSGGKTIEADKVLVATGRRPATAEIGLETVALETDRGFVRVNDRMETKAKGVYCIGDANGRCLLAHAASAHGMTAVENALGHKTEFAAPVPNCVYTFPEIGSVGLTTKQAREQGVPVSVGVFPLGHLGKAMAVGETDGWVKVLRGRDDGRLLGVHVLGDHATDVIAAAGAMLHQKVGAKEFAEVVFAHPTFSEALKEAAEDSFQAALHLPPRKVVRIAAE
ncbi:MAG TPA: dihydrolipoyl dehydrogenase [Phycisphaerales bacterium]|nr:dihydrolipoyl dehydrogenase [Phycisphaerales bacterium]